jgi:hypothetical protein
MVVVVQLLCVHRQQTRVIEGAQVGLFSMFPGASFVVLLFRSNLPVARPDEIERGCLVCVRNVLQCTSP